jgi:hypothetical protein
MKNAIIMLFVCLVANLTFSQKIQEKKVPVLVQSSFEKAYPEVKKIKWEKEDVNFEAQFEIKEVNFTVVLNSDGKILETEEEIKVNQLSKNIEAYVAKNYPNKKIIAAAKITDSKNILTFEAEIKGKDLIFDTKGNFVKEVND